MTNIFYVDRIKQGTVTVILIYQFICFGVSRIEIYKNLHRRIYRYLGNKQAFL